MRQDQDLVQYSANMYDLYSVQDTCTIADTDLTNKSKCTIYPQRAFSLYTMHNYARFLQRWYRTFSDSVDTAALFTAEITLTFLSYAPIDSSADPASWLTIASGMFTSAGAFLPGINGAIVNEAAGILTAAAGIVGLASESPPEDPRFTDFAGLEDSIGNMKLVVLDAIGAYFKRLLTASPPDGDMAAGTELAHALNSGVFADQDFGTGEGAMDITTMTRLIQAAIISEAWNSGKVAILKWSSTGEMSQYFNPCFGEERYGLDHIVACEYGKNYVIVSGLAWGIRFGFFLLRH